MDIMRNEILSYVVEVLESEGEGATSTGYAVAIIEALKEAYGIEG